MNDSDHQRPYGDEHNNHTILKDNNSTHQQQIGHEQHMKDFGMSKNNNETVSTSSSSSTAFTNEHANMHPQEEESAVMYMDGLTLRNVCYKKKDKMILSDISCTFPQGQMTCIIGSSGSGKSSLLDLISRRVNNSKECFGEVEFKGRPMTKKLFQKEGGYVFQDDVLLATDTIHETLLEASLLKSKLSKNQSLIQLLKERSDRTFEIENQMGLYSCRKVKIGNGEKKGASGGQKRRVSIAIQLINNPDLLLLDEYSSGLDSFTAFQIGKTLSAMARDQKKTILATLHQPSSSLFALFDNVMLLSKGRLIYFGPISEIKSYFSKIGYSVPQDTNLADWLINTVSNPFLQQQPIEKSLFVDLKPELQKPQQPLALLEQSESQLSISVEGNLGGDEQIAGANNGDTILTTEKKKEKLENEMAVLQNRVDWMAEVYKVIQNARMTKFLSQNNLSTEKLEVQDDSSPTHPQKLQPLTSSQQQLDESLFSRILIELVKYLVLVWRHLRTTVRDPLILISELFQTIFLGLFTGLLYFRLPLDQQSITDRISALFFVVACAAYAPSASVVATFPQQRALMSREREGNLYGTFTYYAAYTTVHTPVEAIFPCVMLICTYWLVGFQNRPENFFILLGILIIVQWLSESLGLLVGALVKTVDVGNLALSVLMTIWMCFGGYLIRNSQIGWWFYPFSYTSLFRYSIHAMAQNEFNQLNFKCAAVSKALQSVNISDLCSFRNDSSILLPNSTDYLPLQPYTTEICSGMNWNDTITTLSSFGCLQNGEQALAYVFQDSKIPIWGNVLILFGMFVFLRICIYLALRFRRFGKK
ncbi:hypothetical protein C9374_007526 [Naegleria lovaniensis]|uniref:ABC transporter domain-containing protein n=1 Tax=Naegleria lovaniensis TaxID=51637 RepID=A0AA88GH76_NAELO|nr:uncharacterized protein C9374_007526 [Naegleria lovaniensis]KAG2379387.1 hypothetical protein C9374_007526 [Naegleria lovaniensis]